jgi:pimeloyl-ACP methyl ester carboxylesterase
MADRFPADCYIVGVSFGGMVALEVSRTVRPAGCILISSVCGPDELPPSLRVWRIIGGRNCSRLLKLVGNLAAIVPKSIRTNSTMRATKLRGDAGAWHRWATSAVLGWQPGPQPISSPLLTIHGDADTTFPIRYTHADVVVPDGRHALPISHPVETANAIVAFTNTA